MPGTSKPLEELVRSHKSGRLGHALFIEGAGASDRMDLALKFASYLFCEKTLEDIPCGQCVPCRLIREKSHPDCVIVGSDAQTGVLKIESIRRLVQASNLKPYHAASKLFIIEHADAMTEDAQNALLKTLEEPQVQTRLILMAPDRRRVLPTVCSRCQFYRVGSGRKRADPSDQSPLRAEILGRLERGQALSSSVAEDRQSLAQTLGEMSEFFRDALMIRIGFEDLLLERDEEPDKRRWAQKLGDESLADAVNFLSELKQRVESYANLKLVLFELSNYFSRCRAQTEVLS